MNQIPIGGSNVGTDLFAKPDLYGAMQEIDRLMAADRLRQSWRLILTTTQSNSLAGMASMAAAAREAERDMQAVVQNNACSGAGLKRFEENMRRFALNEEAIRLDGSRGVQAAVSQAWSSFTPEDYAQLIDELVAEQSRTWAVNRYLRGSVTGVSVSAQEGSPSSVAASYAFDGFNGRSRGSVELTFTAGRPVCLEFFDAPGVCRTPSRSIVAEHVEEVRTRPATERSAEPKLAAEPAVETMAASPAEHSSAQTVGRTASRRAPATPELRATAEPETLAESEITVKPQIAAEPSAPPPPRRLLTAVNYVQGIKDACLEVLTGGERREPDTGYCFCLSASVGSTSVPEDDVRWFFENFSEAAIAELERRHRALARPFASCRAQRDARSPD